MFQFSQLSVCDCGWSVHITYTGAGFVYCTNLWRTVLITTESELNNQNARK